MLIAEGYCEKNIEHFLSVPMQSQVSEDLQPTNMHLVSISVSTALTNIIRRQMYGCQVYRIRLRANIYQRMLLLSKTTPILHLTRPFASWINHLTSHNIHTQMPFHPSDND